jgi:hypothetical protein
MELVSETMTNLHVCATDLGPWTIAFAESALRSTGPASVAAISGTATAYHRNKARSGDNLADRTCLVGSVKVDVGKSTLSSGVPPKWSYLPEPWSGKFAADLVARSGGSLGREMVNGSFFRKTVRQ